MGLAQLVGAPVLGPSAEGAGFASDVVIDMHERRIAFVLVAPGPGAPTAACVVAPGGLAIQGSTFRLPPEAQTVEGVPSCSASGSWPPDPRGELPRHVRGSDLLGMPLVNGAGARVGTLRDVVIEAKDGALAHAIGAFERGGPAAIAIRPLERFAGGLAMPTLPVQSPPGRPGAGTAG